MARRANETIVRPRRKTGPAGLPAESIARRPLARALSEVGGAVSSWVADGAAQPLCQAGFIGFCILWWAAGLPTDILTATLSILAITLTQMVLNQQKLREQDDHRRDVAMHAKLDELLRADKNARKELRGIEKLEAREIAALKLRLAASPTDQIAVQPSEGARASLLQAVGGGGRARMDVGLETGLEDREKDDEDRRPT